MGKLAEREKGGLQRLELVSQRQQACNQSSFKVAPQRARG